MKVSSRKIEDGIIISIDGSVDSSTAHFLHEELSKLDIENVSKVEVDLSKMHYVSSAGLREFLILQKRFKNGKLLIKNASSNVCDIFKMTGFANLFDIDSEFKAQTDYSIYSFKEFLLQKTKKFNNEIILDDTFTHWTWEDLDKASNIIAEDLINLGAKKGSHIAICGANSLNWIATFFAIQKIGAMAILVNPLLKAKEICFLSHVGDIDFLCHGIGPWLREDPVSFLNEIIDSSNSKIKALYDITKPVDSNRKVSVLVNNFIDSIETRNDDPCVMIFTSGSTGVPKGVLLSSYNLLTAAKCGTEVMGAYDNDVMCLVLPLFHIFGLAASLLAGLMNNIKTILAPRIKPDSIIQIVDKYKSTILISVPTLLMGIATSPEYSIDAIKSLRFAGIGGAPVSEAQMLYLQKQFPNVEFCIVYGLSEMSPVSFTKRGDTLEHITKTVGTPIDLIKIKIQDVETKTECPMGEVGEILIKGEFLMSGYYKTPIEKQDFDNDGWFHTGDLGFIDSENYIHFAGRKKELIIRGGENIFPGEIQDLASTYKGVFASQIVGLPDDYYGEIVGCALMLKENVSFDEDDFKKYLGSHLAPHKIPSYIFTYDAFPLLANGKVDVLSLKKDMISRIKK